MDRGRYSDELDRDLLLVRAVLAGVAVLHHLTRQAQLDYDVPHYNYSNFTPQLEPQQKECW